VINNILLRNLMVFCVLFSLLSAWACNASSYDVPSGSRRFYIADFETIRGSFELQEEMNTYVESGQWLMDIIETEDEFASVFEFKPNVQFLVLAPGEYECEELIRLLSGESNLFQKFSTNAAKLLASKRNKILGSSSVPNFSELEISGSIYGENDGSLGKIDASILLSQSKGEMMLIDRSSSLARVSLTAYEGQKHWTDINCLVEISNPQDGNTDLNTSQNKLKETGPFYHAGKKFTVYNGIIRVLATVSDNLESGLQLQWETEENGMSQNSTIKLAGLGKIYVEMDKQEKAVVSKKSSEDYGVGSKNSTEGFGNEQNKGVRDLKRN